MSKKITVAIYSKDLGVGGIQKSLLNVLDLLGDDSKYAVDLYLFSKNVFFSNDTLPSNINVTYLTQNTVASRFVPFDLYYFFSRPLITKEYDYVVDFDGFLNKQSVMALKTPAKTRIIWVHTEIYRLYKYYKDRPLGAVFYYLMHITSRNRWKRFDAIVGVSSPILDPLKKRFKDKEYLVIPNGLDAKDIIKKSKLTVDNPIIFDKNKYNILSVGRLSPQKNYPNTIKELADVLSKREDVHYYIVGDGMDRALTEKEIGKYGLSKKVTLIGASNNPYFYYVQADGFILNSKLEGQGIVLMEAKVFGLDLYYPERLSGYIPNLKDYRNDFNKIATAMKHDKKLDYLEGYSNNVSSGIDQLFDRNV